MSKPADRIQGPLPIVFGVTGHRDLRPEDIGKLEEIVRGIFAEIAAKHPHTPLYLFSPLAEGADRLAARVALEMGIPLIAPLPLTQDEYERDFETPLEEFRSLLEKAGRRFELPLLKGYTAEDLREPGEARNHHYAQVGAYIARHSNILIALWDGEPSDKIGGTAQVVKFKREGIQPYGPPPNPLDVPESGPVYHLVTPRISNPQPKDAFKVRHLYPSGYKSEKEAEKAYRRIFGRIETFNGAAARLGPGADNPLLSAEETAGLSQTARAILHWLTTADRLALCFQRYDQWALRGLVLLSVATAVFLQASSGDGNPAWYRAYQLCMAGLFGLYGLSWLADFHNKYLEYRALAEGLRVQLFWRLAGLHHSVADHYLRKQRGELDWIRQAIRTRTIPATAADIRFQTKEPVPERLKLVLCRWVQDQVQYFTRATSRNYRRGWAIRYVGYGAAAVPVILVVVKRFLEGGHPLLIGMGLFLVVAAALLVYAKVQAYAEHSKHYERMRLLFERAEKALQERIQAGQLPEAQHLLVVLGKEALIENSDWVLLHRERPPEPKG